MTERWKAIPDFPAYEVSSHGRVRSFHKRIRGKGYTWEAVDTPQRLLKGGTKPSGYRFVLLCKDGTQRNVMIHQLVAEAFLGPCPEGLEICHNDGNPANNDLGNLRYDTHQANMQDAIEQGTGVGNPLFSNDEVLAIRRSYAADPRTTTEIAEKRGCSAGAISSLLHGQSYSHVGGPTVNGRIGKKIDLSIAKAICRDRKGHGLRYRELGEKYSISTNMAGRIVRGERWPRAQAALEVARTIAARSDKEAT